MSILKSIVGILLFVASVVGGAILGAIVGAIYAPVKLYQVITGTEPEKETYTDDEI